MANKNLEILKSTKPSLVLHADEFWVSKWGQVLLVLTTRKAGYQESASSSTYQIRASLFMRGTLRPPPGVHPYVLTQSQ